MIKKLLSIGTIFILAIGICCYLFIAHHGFNARDKPLAIEAFIARHVRHLGVPGDVTSLKNPLQMSPLAIAEARDHFADHCAVCHANSGDGHTMINDGLYPPAPDLRADDTQALSDGELFYIIKNGIRFTGMPGWGGTDDENWKLVGFIRHLPSLSDKEKQFMEEVNNIKPGTNN